MSDSSTATPEHKAIVQAFAEACRFGDHQQRIDTGAALFQALAASSAKTAEVLVTDARPVTAWRHINTMNLTDDLVWLRWGNVIDGPRVAETDDFDRFREWAPCEAPSDAATRAQAVSLPAEPVKLKVIYRSMPESCGRTNWTAILVGNGEEFTIDRSEFPHRVRYAADCVRHIIGELPERPFILDYDAEERTACHVCGGIGEKDGKPCPGLNFRGTVHNTATPTAPDSAPVQTKE